MHWLLLFFTLILIALGSYFIFESFIEILRDDTLVDKIQPPEVITKEYWFLAELTRITKILEILFKKSKLDTLRCTMGVIFITLSIFSSVYLFHHWNDAEKNKMISKILRIKWDEFKASHKI